MFKNLIITAFLGMLAVLLGAFGSHALKETLSPEDLNSFQTGIRYQFYHVFVLLFINTFHGFSENQKNRLSMLFILGICFFSGSIYAIHLASISPKFIWYLTPLGGLFLVVGWIGLIVYFTKMKVKK
ncbi:DUF423 domain-containing protein [Polaribacter tangerinus]|uniref:DUF423 domain-containing protein n=1 Tax=Polaribacter tangerinus TaxID=1920034 RepID=UPI000B4B167C|nr:DUF423 domain-containing protein [Polaribacter tangerinus]